MNSVSDILSNGIINSILEIINVAVIVVFMYPVDATLATVVVSGLPVFIAIVVHPEAPAAQGLAACSATRTPTINAYLAREH